MAMGEDGEKGDGRWVLLSNRNRKPRQAATESGCVCVYIHTQGVRAPQNRVDRGLHRLGAFARVALEAGELPREEVLKGLRLVDSNKNIGRVCVCVCLDPAYAVWPSNVTTLAHTYLQHERPSVHALCRRQRDSPHTAEQLPDPVGQPGLFVRVVDVGDLEPHG